MKIFQCSGCVGIDQEPDVQPENEALLKIFWRVLFQVSCKDDKVTIPEQKVFFYPRCKDLCVPISFKTFPLSVYLSMKFIDICFQKGFFIFTRSKLNFSSVHLNHNMNYTYFTQSMIVDRSPGYILSSSEGQFPPPLAFHTGRSPFLMLTIIQVQ